MKKTTFSNILKLRNLNNLNNFEIVFEKDQTRIILAIIIFLVVILLFRKKLYYLIEQIIVISIIFLLFLVVSKNLVISVIGSIFIFLLINVTINYTNKIEQFQNPAIGAESLSDEKLTESPVTKLDATKLDATKLDAAKNIKNLIKDLSNKPLSKEDTMPTNDNLPNLGLPIPEYSDDITPTPARKAQEETYKLIDTIKTLKDTIETFGPVLSEGKKIMSLFENMKI